jgi:lycopene cyclase domain-containing protein
MNPRFYYILSLLFVFVVPASFLAMLVWERIPFINFIFFVASITILGSIWDVWAVRHGKRDKTWLWQFNFRDTLGIKVFDLPIEEYLFYISSSLYIVLLWEGIKIAIETGNIFMYIVIPFLGVWSLLCILIPYRLKKKR